MASSTNQVLLGVLDEKIETTVPFTVNKVGGKIELSELKLGGNPTCTLCNRCQTLVTQIYCPLDNSLDHRVLCVFCCSNSSCWIKSEGWTALRILFPDKRCTKTKNTNVFEESWGDGDQDDWGDDDNIRNGNEDILVKNDISNEFNDLKIISNKQNEVFFKCGSLLSITDPKTENILPSFYINVFDETECVKLAQNYDKNNQSDTKIPDETENYAEFTGGSCTIKPEIYERTEHNDKIFHKFSKNIQICPEQIIRYCYGGTPQFARKCDEVIPKCPDCGSSRQYEMQLMPALLPCLSNDNFSIEFSTVLVYTCTKNCSVKDNICVKKEFLIYQDDPDLSYFKGQKQ